MTKKGDYIIVTKHNIIGQDKWDEMYPQGLFGRVIEVSKRFCSRTGERLPDKIVARIVHKYRDEKLSRHHQKIVKGCFKIIKIN